MLVVVAERALGALPDQAGSLQVKLSHRGGGEVGHEGLVRGWAEGYCPWLGEASDDVLGDVGVRTDHHDVVAEGLCYPELFP
jgi:hypothetical protein